MRQNEVKTNIYVTVLLFLILPLVNVFAVDYRAVEKRLADAVFDGELSLQQAAAMMEVLEEMDENEGDDFDLDDLREEIEEVSRGLKKEVRTGEMTEKAAWKEWFEFLEEEVEPAVKEAVREEKISEEQGRQFMREIKGYGKGRRGCDMGRHHRHRGHRGHRGHGHFDIEAAGKRIKAALAAGKITEKQAWEKWNWVKENRLKPKLEAAVKAGKMTKEQVKKVWADIAIGEAKEKKAAEGRKKAAEKQ